MALIEVNFDGLVGPTHNYAGLSEGNVASVAHRGEPSAPRGAALEGLAKMRTLLALGCVQGILPPQERPAVTALRAQGFEGSDAEVIERAGRDAPHLLARCSSASAMWAANAATVAPSTDTDDGRVHLVPANLVAKPHRALETPATARLLRAILPDPDHFEHHDPLPGSVLLGDEGAANHTRLATEEGVAHLFVHGFDPSKPEAPGPVRYPARQSLAASQAVAHRLSLDPRCTCFVRQHPDAIDAGVFHHDVAGVGHEQVLLLHERAFHDPAAVVEDLRALLGDAFLPVVVSEDELSLADAVATYLFNSQLVSLPGGGMALVAPIKCADHAAAAAVLASWVERDDLPIERVVHVDLRQSMCNGGGPACLRLRVPLTDDEQRAVTPSCLLDEAGIDALEDWVRRWHPETLTPADLPDPQLLTRGRDALQDLTDLLALGSVYPFQR